MEKNEKRKKKTPKDRGGGNEEKYLYGTSIYFEISDDVVNVGRYSGLSTIEVDT